MKITLARPYSAASGKRHKADETVDLPRSEALNLLHLGHARHPEQAPTPAPAPKADKPARKDA